MNRVCKNRFLASLVDVLALLLVYLVKQGGFKGRVDEMLSQPHYFDYIAADAQESRWIHFAVFPAFYVHYEFAYLLPRVGSELRLSWNHFDLGLRLIYTSVWQMLFQNKGDLGKGEVSNRSHIKLSDVEGIH